jgi:hypothetical protein
LIETANGIIQAALSGDIEAAEARLLLEGLQQLKPIKQVNTMMNAKPAWGSGLLD